MLLLCFFFSLQKNIILHYQWTSVQTSKQCNFLGSGRNAEVSLINPVYTLQLLQLLARFGNRVIPCSTYVAKHISFVTSEQAVQGKSLYLWSWLEQCLCVSQLLSCYSVCRTVQNSSYEMVFLEDRASCYTWKIESDFSEGHHMYRSQSQGDSRWNVTKCVKYSSFGSRWVFVDSKDGFSLLWSPVLQCKIPCGDSQEYFYLCKIFLHGF